MPRHVSVCLVVYFSAICLLWVLVCQAVRTAPWAEAWQGEPSQQPACLVYCWDLLARHARFGRGGNHHSTGLQQLGRLPHPVCTNYRHVVALNSAA